MRRALQRRMRQAGRRRGVAERRSGAGTVGGGAGDGRQQSQGGSSGAVSANGCRPVSGRSGIERHGSGEPRRVAAGAGAVACLGQGGGNRGAVRRRSKTGPNFVQGAEQRYFRGVLRLSKSSEERGIGQGAIGPGTTSVRQRRRLQEHTRSRAEYRRQRPRRPGHREGASDLTWVRSEPPDRNRGRLRAGFRRDYGSANYQRIRRASFDRTQSLHHLRRFPRLDRLRCLRKRSGAGPLERIRRHPSERLPRPHPARQNQQHRTDHGPEPENRQGAPGSGESRPDAVRDVRHRNVPRRSQRETRDRAGVRHFAPTRPGLGIHPDRWRQVPAGASSRRRTPCRKICRKLFPVFKQATEWSPMPSFCKTPWSSR